MEIKKWEYTDNALVANLSKKCFENFWSFEMVSDTFTQDNFIGFVAKEGNNLIGFIAMVWCIDECEIELIAVEENYRRKGVAKSLVEYSENILKQKGIKKIMLEVRRSNERAQSFYENLNFKYVGCRKNYYGGVEDALLMTKLI